MTTQEDVFLREVDEELNQDRQLAFFRRYGPILGGLALIAVIAVGVIELMRGQAGREAAEASVAYQQALDEGAGPDALMQYASAVDGGYEALAILRAAGTLAAQGQTADAVEAYALAYDNTDLPASLRDLARLRAGYLALDEDGAAADDIVSGIETEAFAPNALEIRGLSALNRGDYGSAAAAFAQLREDATSAAAGRATLFLGLAEAGSAGVPLEASAREENFIDMFGRRLEEAGVGVGVGAPAEGPAAGTPDE